MGIFLAAAPLATCFAGALAYGITSGHAAIANWKLLFLVEGLPTICMTPFVFFFLPDSPHKARFLNEEEKRIALARTVRQVGPSKTERIGSVSLKNVWQTFLDPKPWITALMYFSCNVSFASLPVFLPTILDEMGFTSVTAQGLTAPPYFLAFLVTIGTLFGTPSEATGLSSYQTYACCRECLSGRQDATARSYHPHPFMHWWYRLHFACCNEINGASLRRNFSRCFRGIPCHCKHPPMGRQQPRQ